MNHDPYLEKQLRERYWGHDPWTLSPETREYMDNYNNPPGNPLVTASINILVLTVVFAVVFFPLYFLWKLLKRMGATPRGVVWTCIWGVILLSVFVQVRQALGY